ncbi:MAG: GH116 family glycosyl hydrolase [Bacteroidota bacterium]
MPLRVPLFRWPIVLFVLAGFAGAAPAAAPERGPAGIPAAAWSRDVAASGYKDGAPIGGLGAGTITWRYDGNFYIRLYPGLNDMTVEENWGFYMYQKPQGGRAFYTRLDGRSLGTGQATYHALFPKSWVDYHGSLFRCKARVTQFSPIIPGDYQRTSYPLGIYEWAISNPTAAPCEVGIMLAWYNDSGVEAAPVEDGGRFGLILRRGPGDAVRESQIEFALAAETDGRAAITRVSAAGLKELEKDFAADGALSGRVGAHKHGALAFKIRLEPGESAAVPMVLAWDMPVTLDDLSGPHKYYKRYTRFFGRSGLNSWRIAREALANRATWERAVDAWQDGVINSPRYPDWLKTALFNELYFYFIGGTIWEAGAASGQPDDPDEDMFSHIECFAYPFYGTADVRFYGSWPLLLLWPEIDKQCVRQFSDSIATVRKDRPKPLGTCAHDFGNINSVFTKWNEYTFRDSTQWKDLNAKFVLMVYRDWALTGRNDDAFLAYCWPSVRAAMARVKSQDTDGDGLPNSEGADQTYDNMDMEGNTAYCGGLFLAACLAARELAAAQGHAELAETYQAWFALGRESFEAKLWTGSYYRMDTGARGERIMSDQLCGHWYAKACGLPGIVPAERAAAAYRTIHRINLKRFDGGRIGPVNVIYPDGTVDELYQQTREVWIGTAWALAAGMVQEGLFAEAAEIGYSIYDTIYNTGQFWFRTPEAWCAGLTDVRAPYYMRATAVWALKHAYDIAPGAERSL